MYKLMIADDEQIIVDGIKDSIDWESYDIEVVGTSNDGLEALEAAKLLRPDIIITDIKMPGLNGLELVKELKHVIPDIKIILISAFENFEYAKSALRLGVESYLTKPLGKQIIIDEICKAKDILSQERMELKNKEKFERAQRSNLPILRDHFLNNLILGKSKISLDYQKQFDEYNINMDQYNAGICVCKIDKSGESSDELLENKNKAVCYKINETIKEPMISKYIKVVFCSYNNEAVIIYNTTENSTGATDILNSMKAIRDRVKEELDTSISIGVGRIYPSIKDLHISYQEAVKALKYRLVFGSGSVVPIDDTEAKEIGQVNLLYNINGVVTALQNVLSSGDLDKALKIYDEIICKLQTNKNIPYQYIQLVFCQLLSVLFDITCKTGISLEQIFGEVTNPYEDLLQKQTFEEIDIWFRVIIANTCSFVSQNKEAKINNIVDKAIEYMNKHYNKEISLSEVAEVVSLSPSYFSRLFKEETGVQFIDFIKNLKIEKAKELLKKSNMKIYEISSELGYQSLQYFSSLFKSVVGMTPHEYKMKG